MKKGFKGNEHLGEEEPKNGPVVSVNGKVVS